MTADTNTVVIIILFIAASPQVLLSRAANETNGEGEIDSS